MNSCKLWKKTLNSHRPLIALFSREFHQEPTKHRLAVYIREEYTFTEVVFPSSTIQIIGILLKTNNNQFPTVVNNPKNYFMRLYNHAFNIYLMRIATYHYLRRFQHTFQELNFNRFLHNNRLIQIIDKPTHILGNTLYFIITFIK